MKIEWTDAACDLAATRAWNCTTLPCRARAREMLDEVTAEQFREETADEKVERYEEMMRSARNLASTGGTPLDIIRILDRALAGPHSSKERGT